MGANKELTRIETLSDGVFAIAGTLLILEITVPHVEDLTHPAALWSALKMAWPSFLAYLLSFSSILVAWAGHQNALNMLTGSSKPFLYANGLLLLAITFMPFPTAVLAEYINTPQANVAVMFFSAAWMITNLAFLLWWFSMLRPVRLVPSTLSRSAERSLTRRTAAGCAIYALTTLLAYWQPIAAFAIIFVSQALWIALSVRQHDSSPS